MMEDSTPRLDVRKTAAPQNPHLRQFNVPKLKPMGTIPEITGGPQGGTIDTLAGGTGGFQTSTS